MACGCDEKGKQQAPYLTDKWIESAVKHEQNWSSPENDSLVKQLFDVLNPDSNNISAGSLRTLVVNLDGDATPEALILTTQVFGSATLIVAKQNGKKWDILYTEDFETFYDDPDLSVANTQGANKTFYMRQMYTRGTGIYLDAYRFYKLKGSTVSLVLEIPNRSHLYGWGGALNQEMHSKFSFASATEDQLFVTYDYSFFPGPGLVKGLSWESQEDIALVKGSEMVEYLYDSSYSAYAPTHFENNITEEKIGCFYSLGNDTLFYHAFYKELQSNLTSKDKVIATVTQNFINYMEGDTNAANSQPLKKLGTTGNLDFYGPDDMD